MFSFKNHCLQSFEMLAIVPCRDIWYQIQKIRLYLNCFSVWSIICHTLVLRYRSPVACLLFDKTHFSIQHNMAASPPRSDSPPNKSPKNESASSKLKRSLPVRNSKKCWIIYVKITRILHDWKGIDNFFRFSFVNIIFYFWPNYSVLASLFRLVLVILILENYCTWMEDTKIYKI